MHEMPLIVFTLLEQTAIGLFAALVVMMYVDKAYRAQTAFKIGLVTAALIVVGACVSLLHLGQPFRAPNVLYGLATSWLSREIVFFGLFGLFALVTALVARANRMAAARIAGAIGVVFAALTLISTTLCYMQPGVPSWDSWTTPAQFVLTAVLSGGSLYLALFRTLNRKVVEVFDFTQSDTFTEEEIMVAQTRANPVVWWAIFVILFAIMFISRYYFFAGIVTLISLLPLT